jgi:hypothetical protein
MNRNSPSQKTQPGEQMSHSGSLAADADRIPATERILPENHVSDNAHETPISANQDFCRCRN